MHRLKNSQSRSELEQVNGIEVENNVIMFCKIILDEATQQRQLILNLSGGMRIIVLAAFLASLYMHKYIHSINI